MKWFYKAAIQRAFSIMPFGERLNEFAQRHVTHNLPQPDRLFLQVVGMAKEHLDLISRYQTGPASKLFFEFGAGQDLIVPLTFWALGVEQQFLCDINTLLRMDLLNHAIAQFQKFASVLSLPRLPQAVSPVPSEGLLQLREQYGITYRAPWDARATGLPSDSVDCITSTNTLEHVPADEIAAICRESYRILRPAGTVSFRIDYQDHFASFDPSITAYHFLQHPDWFFRLVNNPLLYQNRLRHKDHLDLVATAGFEILSERRESGSPADLNSISGLNLHRRFRDYTPEELAVRSAVFIARKPVKSTSVNGGD